MMNLMIRFAPMFSAAIAAALIAAAAARIGEQATTSMHAAVARVVVASR